MDKIFNHEKHEDQIYKFWETNGFFKANLNKNKKPFSIILPPANANGNLHMGHAMFVYEDVMIRYNKMKGNETLWLPGLDHAGIETQYVFEKELQKKGKSRFDFNREDLYSAILNFTNENMTNIRSQLRKLGFALDWSREKFTMDKDIVEIVYDTFKKLYDKGLVYRDKKLVNYCIKDGTSFSDLEVEDKEVIGKLYFVKFPLVGGGFITVATTRPETILGDIAVAVNPKDKRFKKFVGKKVVLPLTNREVLIIEDEIVDMEFGTGAVKITPSHDFDDEQTAKKHNLAYPAVIGFDGKIFGTNTPIDGLRIFSAREAVVKKLQELGLIEKVKDHTMVQKTCYKCGSVLEPLPLEQWFIKIKSLADKSIKLIKDKQIDIKPKRFKKTLIDILENFIDWNISRQIVWGIRIPAWKCKDCNKWTVEKIKPEKCSNCKLTNLIQDTDTFDTWFSSSQWPFATLMTQGKDFYEYFYPTSVMETGYDLLRGWVARMIMIGYFVTKKQQFNLVYLHGMVRDGKGQKMSKSKGNVIDPVEKVDKYGADAVRASLIFNIKEGADISLSDAKIQGMRNFANKVWNIGRFLHIVSSPRKRGSGDNQIPDQVGNDKEAVGKDKLLDELEEEFEIVKKSYFNNMDSYKFSFAFDAVYEFLWHRFADYYIEVLKDEVINGNIKAKELLFNIYRENLKLLHPFIPFVTEAVWKEFHGRYKSILSERY